MLKKKIIVTIAAILTFLLCSCNTVPEFVPVDRGSFADEQTGITYVLSNWAVQPVQVSEICATHKKVNFYSIQFEDPKRFICDTDEELIGFIYRNKELPDFTIEMFNPIAAQIYKPGANSLFLEQWIAEKKYLGDEYKDQQVRDDSPYVYAVRDALINGEEVVFPQFDLDEKYTRQIRLLSADFPGLFYLIEFARDYNGTTYLYDRGTKKTVLCPQSVYERIYGNIVVE